MMASRTPPEGKETIGYDEYMDGGIPDSLLEGLGFYKNATGIEADGDGENVDAMKADNAHGNDAVNAVAPPVKTEVQTQSHSRLRSHRMPKIVLRLPPEASPAKQSPQVVIRPPLPLPAPIQTIKKFPTAQSDPVPFRSGRGNSKIVVKGNIMYERTETGEVIASVIKNGIPKPNASDSGVSPTATAAVPSSAPTQQRGRPSVASTERSNQLSCLNGDYPIPPDCPINERTVESVLDRSIAATQTMRRTLTNLKDDLRRMGGGPTVTPALRPIHIQHRIDVACKLASAFVDYRELISKISNENVVPTRNDSAGASADVSAAPAPVPTSVSAAANSGCKREPALPPRATSRHKDVSPPVLQPWSSRPVNEHRAPKSEPSAKRKTPAPVSATTKRKAAVELESIISDDLWMSCEPCD